MQKQWCYARNESALAPNVPSLCEIVAKLTCMHHLSVDLSIAGSAVHSTACSNHAGIAGGVGVWDAVIRYVRSLSICAEEIVFAICYGRSGTIRKGLLILL